MTLDTQAIRARCEAARNRAYIGGDRFVVLSLHEADALLAENERLAAKLAEVTEALDAVGIGCIDGEWYYTCEPHGEVPEESLKAALQAAMTLTPDTPAPSQPDKYEETLAAYRKVNTELTAKLAEMGVVNAELERINAQTKREGDVMKASIAAVEAERDRLRAYTMHKQTCDRWGNAASNPLSCTCGLDAALAGGVR